MNAYVKYDEHLKADADRQFGNKHNEESVPPG